MSPWTGRWQDHRTFQGLTWSRCPGEQVLQKWPAPLEAQRGTKVPSHILRPQVSVTSASAWACKSGPCNLRGVTQSRLCAALCPLGLSPASWVHGQGQPPALATSLSQSPEEELVSQTCLTGKDSGHIALPVVAPRGLGVGSQEAGALACTCVVIASPVPEGLGRCPLPFPSPNTPRLLAPLCAFDDPGPRMFFPSIPYLLEQPAPPHPSQPWLRCHLLTEPSLPGNVSLCTPWFVSAPTHSSIPGQLLFLSSLASVSPAPGTQREPCEVPGELGWKQRCVHGHPYEPEGWTLGSCRPRTSCRTKPSLVTDGQHDVA